MGKIAKYISKLEMVESRLKIDKVPYLYDRSGRIWLEGEKVYRIIDDEQTIKYYKELLLSEDINDLFECGLIRTQIVEERESEGLLILEHKKIPFILHPYEYSNRMFWEAALMFIRLNQKLWERGFVTQDSHPWNITYTGSKPVFYDFGSIVKSKVVSEPWLNEFYSCFIVPIWLASYSTKTYKFAKEYRREHEIGFGIEFFNSTKLKKILFRRVKAFYKLRSKPEELFKALSAWIIEHEPIEVVKEYWSDYYSGTGISFEAPKTIKQNFVYKILSQERPDKVLDLASNKGYYSNMAVKLGASVLAFDNEEEVVNSLLTKDNITAAHMDFKRPTSSLGAGLFWQDSFYRFKSEIVLALGLIHHICIGQKMPVYLFCETCKKYASNGIILEFVDPMDKHVKAWKAETPKDYSIDKISYFMQDKFPNRKIVDGSNSDGINRSFIYFYK